MTIRHFFIILLFCIGTNACQEKPYGSNNQTDKKGMLEHPDQVNIKYINTARTNKADNYFGQTIPAPFRWLEESEDPMVKSWVQRQNQLARNYLMALPQRQNILDRLKVLWNFEKYTAPFKEGDYYYYFKNDGLQNQSVMYQCIDLNKLEEARVFLDPNTLSEEGTTALMGQWFSKDGRYMAFSSSQSGSDWQSIQIKDSKGDSLLSDKVEWVRYSNVSWYKDGFFYSRYDAPQAGKTYTAKNEFHQLYYHRIGSPQSEDELIFVDKSNPGYNFSPQVTDDERYLIIYTTASTKGNGLLFKRLDKKNSYVETLISNFQNDYEVLGNLGSRLLIRTNYNAPNYQLIEVDLKKPDEKDWNLLIPQTTEVLEEAVVVGRRLVLKYNKDVSHILKVHEIDGSFVGNIRLPDVVGVGTPVSIRGLKGKKGPNLGSFSFSSFTVASSTCTFDVQSLQAQIWQAPKLPFKPEDYVTEQVFFKYKDARGDSIRIPMFITMKKGLERKGNNPTILYGYGGFNISIMPSFALDRIPFLEEGGIYAVANIRGGGEYGENWHKAGTQLNKQNVFNDFIASAEYLIEKGYTRPEKLAIEGRSNGGLLVGACMTQRPELFRVALPIVGVLDMLRYHKFTIGRFWATDYGTSEDEVHFKNLLSYSPLHNVKATNYPATLIQTADHDDRVVPAHSYKFGAALQAAQQSKLPILLAIDQNAGHGAGKPTEKRLEEIADKLAFTLFNLQ